MWQLQQIRQMAIAATVADAGPPNATEWLTVECILAAGDFTGNHLLGYHPHCQQAGMIKGPGT